MYSIFFLINEISSNCYFGHSINKIPLNLKMNPEYSMNLGYSAMIIYFNNFIPQKGDIIGKLLGVEGIDLYKNLCKPKIKVGNEFVSQGRSVDQVSYAVGAIAKGLFDRLFKWLVVKCNMTLDTTGSKRAHFIGVLDIAGFEIFDVSKF